MGAKGVGKIESSKAIKFGEDSGAIRVTTIIIIKGKVLFIIFLSLISLNLGGSLFVK